MAFIKKQYIGFFATAATCARDPCGALCVAARPQRTPPALWLPQPWPHFRCGGLSKTGTAPLIVPEVASGSRVWP